MLDQIRKKLIIIPKANAPVPNIVLLNANDVKYSDDTVRYITCFYVTGAGGTAYSILAAGVGVDSGTVIDTFPIAVMYNNVYLLLQILSEMSVLEPSLNFLKPLSTEAL